MVTARVSIGTPCRIVSVVLTVMLAGQLSSAAPPRNGLPIPLYTLDSESPTIMAGIANIHSDEILRKLEGNEYPVTDVLASGLNLGRPADDLDGISFNRIDVADMGNFILLFSVDRMTTGDVPPDPVMVDQNMPFNVTDQAMRGHAAADGFVSQLSFDRNGILSKGMRDSIFAANIQVINNYDEGGHDFQSEPFDTSSVSSVGLVSQDNVNAMAYATASTTGLRTTAPLYYSLAVNSQSLDGFLPGSSAADIFFDPEPEDPIPPVVCYATAFDLGILAADDIDALVILDQSQVGVFDQGDLVLFSLAPGSPSLQFIPGTSVNGAADVFSTQIGSNGLPEVRVFAHAVSIGLEGVNDNLNALEVVSCMDATNCVEQAGIRLIHGDWSNDANVDIHDLPGFVECMDGPVADLSATVYPSRECRDIFDIDNDQDVDLVDFAAFQEVFGYHGSMPK